MGVLPTLLSQEKYRTLVGAMVYKIGLCQGDFNGVHEDRRKNVVFVKAYAITLIVFLGLDFLWLGFVARGFYASQLGGLMRENINYLAAGIFYLAYVAGIVFFAIAPALAEGSWRKAVIHGAMLGLLAYGTYDYSATIWMGTARQS